MFERGAAGLWLDLFFSHQLEVVLFMSRILYLAIRSIRTRAAVLLIRDSSLLINAFCFTLLAVFSIFTSCANEFALQVIDITFVIEKVFLLVTFDLNTAQALFRKILGIVNVNHIFILISFRVLCDRIALFVKLLQLFFLTICLLLKGHNLALCQGIQVDLTIRLVISLVGGLFLFERCLEMVLIHLLTSIVLSS